MYNHLSVTRKRLDIRWLGLVSLLFFLLACTDDADDRTAPKVFHYNQPNNITSLDPAFARSQNNIWAVDHLYNGLVQLDDSLNIRPSIAKRWTVDTSGREYTFYLRNDVYFHDDSVFPEGKGRKLNAGDVAYSLGRIIDAEVNSPGSWIFKNRVDSINPFIAKNDTTFSIRLLKPFRPIMGILTMQYCRVVAPEVVEKYGNQFRSHPVGTGPFYLKKWLENQALFLIRNENYFEKENGTQLPIMEGIRLSFMGDRMTAFLELVKGNIDCISGIESAYANELITPEGNLQARQKGRIRFYKNPYLNTEYLGINVDADSPDHPLKNKKIRQALNYGVDRKLMLRTLRNSVGRAANSGFTPRGLPSFDPVKVPGYSYNPTKARQLLTEAGYPNGEGLDPIKLLTNKDYLDICTFVSKQWEDLGLKIEIEVLESATLRAMMRKGNAPFFRASWIADYPDAESFLTVFYGKNPAPPNYTHFKNPEFDRLYEAALNENDDSLRYDLYQQMDRILIEEAPVVFLFYDETALFVKEGIQGISENAINLLSVKKIREEN